MTQIGCKMHATMNQKNFDIGYINIRQRRLSGKKCSERERTCYNVKMGQIKKNI